MQRIRVSIHGPVVPDADDGLQALGIEDIDEILGDVFVSEFLVIGRLGRPSVSQAIRHDDAIPQGLQVGDLAGPVGRSRGEAVDEE